MVQHHSGKTYTTFLTHKYSEFQLSELRLYKYHDNLNALMTDLFCCCVRSIGVNDCSITEW